MTRKIIIKKIVVKKCFTMFVVIENFNTLNSTIH